MKCLVSVREQRSSANLNFPNMEGVPSLRTMGDKAAKVAAHDAMPGGALPLVKLWRSRVS